MQPIHLQPLHLENDLVKLLPLSADDFEILYQVASDPLIWEQHPNPDRYKKEVFATYFEGALASQGAFLILDATTGKPIGSSRFYDHDPANNTLFIGYTFLARSHWGTTTNRALKTVMLNHAFTFVDAVRFHIGANNIRSQMAITKLGATKIGEEEVAYYGESVKTNFIYEITKAFWLGQ